MEEILKRRGMEHGPYLLFLRSSIGFSDHHEFSDWPPLADALGRQMWGDDSVVTMFSTAKDLLHLAPSDLPDWAEYVEIASVTSEYASNLAANRERINYGFGRDTETYFREEEHYWPSVANMMFSCDPAGAPDKASFDRRLLILVLNDPGDQGNDRIVQDLRKRLGGTSAGVWHSRGVLGIAFKDARPPRSILNGLRQFSDSDRVYDIGVFRLAAAAALRADMSPMQAFLAS